MKDIKITVADKKATLEGTPVIVCGNSDYTVTFSFDEEWSAMGPRTARFVYIKNGEKQHADVVFSGATAAVPVLADVAFVQVGVFEGNLATTTPARILCSPSILCGTGGAPDSLTEDVYNQLLALVVDLAEKGAFGATEEQMQLVEQNARNIEQNAQSIAQGIAQLDSKKADQESVNVLAARMNTFTALPAGSTSNDAELEDIRVSDTGETYETAGEAVRGQIRGLKGDLVQYLKNASETEITISNYVNFFDNLSSINGNCFYHIVGVKDIDPTAPTSKPCLFVHYSINKYCAWQIIFETGNEPNTYIRYRISGNWSVWRNQNYTQKKTSFVVDKNGAGDFTSFVDCLTTLREDHVYNAEIYVKSGVYDIYEEMKEKYGADYWANYDRLTSRYSNGLPFGYGMKIHGDNGVELVCHHTEETDARSYFSILNAMEDGGYEHLGASVEGIKFDASNIRYCIHLEFSGYEVGGEYKVKDCSMYLDNSNNAQWHHSAGVGMGSGAFTTFIVENCDVHPVFSNHTEKKSAILWHNTVYATPKNKVIIKDNFCDGDSTISIASSGDGTTKTPCIVTNNSVGIDLLLINTDTDPDNVKVMEWNNTVRN